MIASQGQAKCAINSLRVNVFFLDSCLRHSVQDNFHQIGPFRHCLKILFDLSEMIAKKEKEEQLEKLMEKRKSTKGNMKKAKAMANRTKDNLQYYTKEKLDRYVLFKGFRGQFDHFMYMYVDFFLARPY